MSHTVHVYTMSSWLCIVFLAHQSPLIWIYCLVPFCVLFQMADIFEYIQWYLTLSSKGLCHPHWCMGRTSSPRHTSYQTVKTCPVTSATGTRRRRWSRAWCVRRLTVRFTSCLTREIQRCRDTASQIQQSSTPATCAESTTSPWRCSASRITQLCARNAQRATTSTTRLSPWRRRAGGWRWGKSFFLCPAFFGREGGFPELTDFCVFFFSLSHFYIVWSSPDESEGDKVRHPTDDPGQAEKNGRHQKSSGSKQSRSLIGSKSQACNQVVHLSVYLFI